MGIAWLLLRRTFAARPKRTLLFLLGYAFATAVMITLLAVGEAVLLQAQDKDLLGGGDLILVPQGIDVESLKVGGVSALYYSIPQGRFIVRQLLRSSRFQNEIMAASPYIFSKLLYARESASKRAVEPIFAEGSIPAQEEIVKGISLPWKNSQEDDSWINPPIDEFYHQMDHFHLPSVDSPQMDRWAEWHYFNFESERFYGYLSVMVTGNILSDNAKWIVSLQLFDGQYQRHTADYPAKKTDLPLVRVDYQIEGNKVRFVEDHYEILLAFQDRVPVSGRLLYYPAPGLYFPPFYLAHSKTFESGYVIPAIRGKYEGSIQVGKKTYDFDGIPGYHDHNWGIWQKIEWNWGHAYSEEYAIFFGEIFLKGKSKGLFIGVFDRNGFLAVFRPDRILFADHQQRPEGVKVPARLEMNHQKNFASIRITGQAESIVATPVAESQYFIQYKMKWDVFLEIDGKKITFPAQGNAETFVPAKH